MAIEHHFWGRGSPYPKWSASCSSSETPTFFNAQSQLIRSRQADPSSEQQIEGETCYRTSEEIFCGVKTFYSGYNMDLIPEAAHLDALLAIAIAPAVPRLLDHAMRCIEEESP